MNYIKNLESKLSDCNRCVELFRKIHVELIKQHGVDVRSGDTHSKTYAARYAMLYELKKTGVTDTFLAELLGYARQSGVSVAMNRIKGYVKNNDALFMHWYGIIKNINE